MKNRIYRGEAKQEKTGMNDSHLDECGGTGQIFGEKKNASLIHVWGAGIRTFEKCLQHNSFVSRS